MVFYEGALQYETLKNMPLPELFRMVDNANKIKEEREKQQ